MRLKFEQKKKKKKEGKNALIIILVYYIHSYLLYFHVLNKKLQLS